MKLAIGLLIALCIVGLLVGEVCVLAAIILSARIAQGEEETKGVRRS